MKTIQVHGYDDSKMPFYRQWNGYRAKQYTARDISIGWKNGYVYAFCYF